MHPRQRPQPRHVHYSARHQARLDASTLVKLDELRNTCHRKRSAILRFVMQWGLGHSERWTIDQAPVVAVPSVGMLLEPELLQQMQDAAAFHGTSVACWLRHALRQVNPHDFPPSWRAGETAVRSHESGYYFRKYQLRLDEATSQKLEALTHTFDRPAAEVIRQLILQAKPNDFPPSWRMAMEERRAQRTWRTPDA